MYCRNCDELVEGVLRSNNFRATVLCADCKESSGWTVLYDRDAGIGTIPANLLKEYPDVMRTVSGATPQTKLQPHASVDRKGRERGVAYAGV